MRMTGSTVFITGAGRGIGRALALASAEAGASVAVTDLRPELVESLAAELGDGHWASTVDVRDEAALEAALTEAARVLGPIEVCFSNAGIADGTDPIATPPSVWRRALEVNVGAHVTAARALLPGWLERGAGTFVVTASAAGLLTQIGSAPYAVSKHACVAFAEWLSVTYGDRGVGVSCICPMGVDTAMIRPGESGALEDLGSRVVRDAAELVTPDAVATQALAAVETGRFLVLPHQEVAVHFRRKAEDYERWLVGMRRLRSAGERA
jgi:NAD(P)-dependent dehydrogenase (short-subunit alcohol dehydrogenase family)